MQYYGSVRVVDGGGNGLRRVDMRDGKPSSLVESRPFESLSDVMRFITANRPSDSIGTAVCVAGIIQDHLRVLKSPNVPILDETPLASLIHEATKSPAWIYNDMEGSVAGMALLVPEVRGKLFVGITLSTGIGYKYVDENGRIIFPACEGGHNRVDCSPFATLCGCGKRGCVEAVAGGEAIRRRVINETQLRHIRIPPDVHPCVFLDQAFDAGDAWATDIYFNIVSEGLALLFASIINETNIRHVVWKGTFAKAMLPRVGNDLRGRIIDKVMDPVSVRQNLWFHLSPQVDGINNSDTFVGADQLFRNRVQGWLSK